MILRRHTGAKWISSPELSLADVSRPNFYPAVYPL